MHFEVLNRQTFEMLVRDSIKSTCKVKMDNLEISAEQSSIIDNCIRGTFLPIIKLFMLFTSSVSRSFSSENITTE